MIRPESPVFVGEYRDIRKQTTRINIRIDCDILARFGRWRLEDQVLPMLRDQLEHIILGAVLLFIGLAACSIAGIRRRSGARVFIWLGTWSAMYGASVLTRSPAVVAALPHSMQISVPYVNTGAAYLIVVVASLAFLELSLGRLRLLIKIVLLVGTAVAGVGIGWFVYGGSEDKFLPYNHLAVVCFLLKPVDG